MRRPALVFDFGNVLAFFDYTRAAEAIGRRLGLSGAALIGRMRTPGFDEQIRLFECGKTTAEAFSRDVCALAGLQIPYEQFAAAWCDIFWLNEPVARLVADLKRREYPLVLGSNTNDLHAAHYRRQFAEALAPFDRLVLSYEVGHMKPAPEFFRACAEAAGTPASGCVFVDDLPENVEGARAVGMRGVVYRDTPSLVADLRSLGVDAPDPESSG
jgi:putative hydrolase of the HAD superfamily